MASFNAADFLPLAARLGVYIKAGADHYATLKNSGIVASPEILGAFIEMKMADWNPDVRGVKLLDDNAKHDGALFLARVIINVSKGAAESR